jgi:hypothetical protein
MSRTLALFLTLALAAPATASACGMEYNPTLVARKSGEKAKKTKTVAKAEQPREAAEGRDEPNGEPAAGATLAALMDSIDGEVIDALLAEPAVADSGARAEAPAPVAKPPR